MINHRVMIVLAAAAFAVPFSAPASARDSLGIFADWGAFRDPGVPRCYAIAKAAPSTLKRDQQPYASIGTWPKRNVRGQVHLRLSRNIADNAPIRLSVGGSNFELTGSGANAWARDKTMDAAIVAAMRSSSRMTVRSRDASGRNFSNTYDMDGAATAMDAATVGCASIR